MLKDCLYVGHVFHKRFGVKEHQFKYNVFTIFVNLDHLDALDAKSHFFSLNRFNLVSVYEKDFGDPKIQARGGLKPKLCKLLEDNGLSADQFSDIWMLAYPRILGFAFNPITVFYCFNAIGETVAIIYEVRNTFSERHNYIFIPPDKTLFGSKHKAEKNFHVSPFFDKNGDYEFSISEPDDNVRISIDYMQKKVKRLVAIFTGKRLEFSNKNLAILSLKMPFMTLKVVAAILFEALRIMLKGYKIRPHKQKHAYQSTKAALSKTKLSKHLKGGKNEE